ncbi:hypothetical protein [Microbacterium testaceum]|uniref:hypothetical protein n=1 Tax=Microbacterium testaceum TaxID=2033 RepID=UPI00187C2C54|nr:hypothetical protein [Microbacterium testaceum]
MGASTAVSATSAGDLSRLAGPPRPRSATASSDLAALVGARPDDGTPSSSSSDLTALVGGAERAVASSSAADLSAMVGSRSAEKLDDAGWRAPDLAQAGKRPLFGGRRKAGPVNYLSVAVAAIAVVALVGTASFAVFLRATANPADDAMVSLREREAELANETKVLQTAVDLYAGSTSEAASLAETSAPVLAALQGRVDGAALAAAENARAVLAQKAQAAVSVSVPAYQRDSIDEKSLDDVGQAIDDVRLARETLPPLISEARDARSSVVTALSDYRTALGSLGAAIQSEAAKLVAANDSAGSAFRAAVTDAAARIVSAQQAGGDGLSDMPAYAVAVDALRAENARIVALEEAEREATPNRPSNPNGGTDNGRDPDSDSSDPGTPSPEPSQPAPSPDPEPSPEPTQPEPTPDPEPTEPSIPNPDPTTPIEGGSA